MAILFLTTGDSSDGENTVAADLRVGEPAIVSEEELRAFAGDQAVPVYWAGPRRPSAYELTRTDDGRVFIRYLPEGANPGDPSPRFLTVASYAQPNAYRFLRAQSRRDGWSGQRTGSGALVAYADRRPTSVYFAFADADLQVEVYDPDSGVARTLGARGRDPAAPVVRGQAGHYSCDPDTRTASRLPVAASGPGGNSSCRRLV